MFSKRILAAKGYLLASLLVVSLVLFAACSTPTPEVVEVVKTVVVTEVVEKEGKEVVVEKTVEVVVTATPAPVEPTKDPNAPKEGGKGDVFRAAILSDMTTMNYWSAFGPINSSMWNYVVVQAYYPRAYTTGTAHRWDYAPILAMDMPSPTEQEGDFWVSTVTLRDDIMWSDGTKITAHDWAWTANVALKLNLQGNWTQYDPAYLDHIEAVDDVTAKLYYHTKPGLAVHEYGTLGAPWMNKAFWSPMVDPLVERMETEGKDLDPESDEYIALQSEIVQALETLDPTGEPSGGPWAFGQWEAGAFVENVRHENYFDYMREVTEYEGGGYKQVVNGREWSSGDTSAPVQAEYKEGPWFDKTLFSIYSTDAAVLALDAGEVDFIITPNGLSQGQIAQLSPNPDISISTNPANGFRYLSFNFSVPVLHDAAIRQATACMIDKEFLTQSVLQGAAIPVDTIVPEANAYWYNPDVPLFCDGMTTQERMEEAVRILKDAGYTWDTEPYWREDRGGTVEWGVGLKDPNGQYVPTLRLLAPSAGYDPLRATTGVYIEQWMNQLGIPVEAELTNFNRILEIRTDPTAWDMYILGWGLSTFPDYACRFLQPGAGWNYGAYDSEEFDTVCNELLAETDREKAREQAFKIQEILATDLPYLYLFTTPMADAWDNTQVMYPFTDVIDGIGSGYYGLQEYVMAVAE
ncbi:MAG: ABC transporter substrate-binding protein [Anaerolineae bacterium]|nr:ABC transporter substrate-binding protein [Anaerolineae bacterium]